MLESNCNVLCESTRSSNYITILLFVFKTDPRKWI